MKAMKALEDVHVKAAFVVFGILVALSFAFLALTYGDVGTGDELKTLKVGVSKLAFTVEDQIRRAGDDARFFVNDDNFVNLLNRRGDEKVVDTIRGVYLNYLKTHQSYAQIRYIDENGNEIIKVERDETGSFVAGPLGNQANALFFSEAMKRKKGKLYVSDISLKRVGGKVVRPYTPLIQFAVPVFDEAGQRKGVFVMDYLAEELLEKMKISAAEKRVYMMIDPEGYYTYQPDEAKRWGGPLDLNTRENIWKDYPKLADEVVSGNPSNLIVTFDKGSFYYQTVYPDAEDDRSWVIIGVYPPGLTSLLLANMTLFAIIIISVGFLGIAYARFVGAEFKKVLKAILLNVFFLALYKVFAEMNKFLPEENPNITLLSNVSMVIGVLFLAWFAYRLSEFSRVYGFSDLANRMNVAKPVVRVRLKH